MARTSHAPEATESVFAGATILPGVPLPSWARPDEPVAPEPEPEPDPAPSPEPVLVAAPGAAVVSVGHDEVPSPVSSTPVSSMPVSPYPGPDQDGPEELTSTPVPEPAPELDVAPVPVLAPLAAEPSRHMAPPPELVEGAAEEAPVGIGRRGRHGHRFGRRGAAAAAAVAPEVSDEDAADAIPQLAPPTPVPPRAELYAAAGAAPPTAPWGTPPATVPVDLLPPTTEPVDLAPVESEGASDVVEDEARSAPGSRRSLVALGAIGGVLVLGAVAAFVWPGFLVAEETPTASVPRPAVSLASTVTLTAPATVAGMTRLAGAPAEALSKTAAASMLVGYAAPVSAVYGSGTTPGATVLAWKALKPGSPADVVTAFGGYQGTTGQPVTGIVPVDTGTLGGRMSCGTGVVGAMPASVCFWSDDATFGAVTVLRPASAAAGATTAVAIRTAMEKKA